MKLLSASDNTLLRRLADRCGLHVITPHQYKLLQWAERQIQIQRLQEESADLLREVSGEASL